MPYLDETEEAVPEPIWCPVCQKPLKIKWRPHVHSNRHGDVACAWPLFVCDSCALSVRLAVIPPTGIVGGVRVNRKLFTTKAGAVRAAQRETIENDDYRERLGYRRRGYR